jgi:hypothetical protein
MLAARDGLGGPVRGLRPLGALDRGGDLLEQLILVGGVSGIGLLLLRVLIDRLDALKTDRYREVQK